MIVVVELPGSWSSRRMSDCSLVFNPDLTLNAFPKALNQMNKLPEDTRTEGRYLPALRTYLVKRLQIHAINNKLFLRHQ